MKPLRLYTHTHTHTHTHTGILNNRRNNGITLIALVVTIIVLLILAGISISMLTGQNGILQRAGEAGEKTQAAQEEELRRLTQMEAATNLENTTHTDNSTGEPKTVTIPAGFAVSQVEGENTIADGLVVIDQNGNEFVWVPVQISNFRRIKSYYYGNLQDVSFFKEPYINGYEKEEEEYQEMYESVIKNEGFYIGRYETGKVKGKTVVKKNVPVYNNIMWSESMSSISDEGAVQLSRNFKEEQEYKNVQSTLIYGIQWDATMQFFDNNYIKEDGTLYSLGSYVADSIGYGWYNDNYNLGNPQHITGIDIGKNSSNCIKNIYDMAGNVREWTMEVHSMSSKRVIRGGRYSADGRNTPSSCRDGGEPNAISDGTGFRITLYIK